MFDFLANRFSSIFSTITGSGTLTEKNIEHALDSVKDALLEADVPYGVVQEFCESVAQDVAGQKVLKSFKPGEQFIKVVYERLKAFLEGNQTVITRVGRHDMNEKKVGFTFQIPSVTMVMGLQGAGKTTSIAKMVHYVMDQAKQRNKVRKILVASVDFYRPAAIDQLEQLSQQLGVSFYRSPKKDVVSAAQDCYNYYKNNGYELLFLDTAGRLHIDNQMMQELSEINALIKPRYKMLIVDAMTGQESLTVAQAFAEAVGFDHAMLTKMDSETRSGAAFAFKYVLKKPIIFVGSGEKVTDMTLFYPERMASRILGMGDLESLVEKAEREVKKSEQESLYQAFKSGNMTLQHFADQMSMVNRLGSLTQVMKYIPGMNSASISPDMLQKGEKEMKRFQAIIGSMTAKERLNHRILDDSRKKRIAYGSGTAVNDIDILLQRFEQSQQYVKLFKSSGKSRQFFK